MTIEEYIERNRTRIVVTSLLLVASLLLYAVPACAVSYLERTINVYLPRVEAERLTALKWSIIRLQPILTGISVVLLIIALCLIVFWFRHIRIKLIVEGTRSESKGEIGSN
jgi:hypothetical protein